MKTEVILSRSQPFGLAVLAFLAALTAACAPTTQSTAPRTGATAEPAAAAASPEATAAKPSVLQETRKAVNEAEDQTEWKVDEQGRQYSVVRYPKDRGHRKLDTGFVRIAGGMELELLGEDDEVFLLKLPRTDRAVLDAPRAKVSRAPTPEALAEAARSYPGRPESLDRIQLAPFDRGLPTRGHWRNGFDIVDINRDGELDLVHGPPRKGGDQLRVFLGDGKGQWRPWPTRVPPGLLDYGDVKVADFDGDGNLDVVAAVHLRGVIVLLGDGKGQFTPFDGDSGLRFKVPTIGEPAPVFSARRVRLADWDRDGKVDLLAYSEGPTSSLAASHATEEETAEQIRLRAEFAQRGLLVFRNLGDGRWSAIEPPETAKDLFGDDFAVADLDGDGAVDVLLASNLMGRDDLIYMNDATSGRAKLGTPLSIRPRGYVLTVVTGDWNGDGRLDLATSYANHELAVNRVGIDVYIAEAEGTYRREPLFSEEGLRGVDALGAGDVNGDGALDLAGLDRDGGLLLFLGDGKGKFTSESSPEAQQPRGLCRGYSVRFVDLDRDGRDEIVASYADEPSALFDPLRCPGNGGVAVFRNGASK